VFKKIYADGVHQVGFPKTGSSVDEQWVVGFRRRFGYGQRRCVGVFVAVSHDKIVERISGIENLLFPELWIHDKGLNFLFFFGLLVVGAVFDDNPVFFARHGLEAGFDQLKISVFQDLDDEVLVGFQVDNFYIFIDIFY